MLTLLRHDPGSVAPRPPEYFPPLSRAARTCIVKAKPAYFAPQHMAGLLFGGRS